MWKVLTGKRKSKVVNKVSEYKYIQREDGLTLSLEGVGREEQQEFLLKGEFGEFHFFALRWDESTKKPLDYYIVYVKLMASGPPYDKKEHEDLLKRYASDIESALLNFPNFLYPEYEPAKEVLFNVSQPGQVHHLVKLEALS